MLDHNIVKSHIYQELTYGLWAVQPFRIGAIPQHAGGFGYDQFPYAYHVLYQFTFPTDHDILGGFMPGLGTKWRRAMSRSTRSSRKYPPAVRMRATSASTRRSS